MSRIWLDDVAEAISNAHCPNDYLSAIGFKNNLLRQLRDAALNGELACYNSVGKYKPRAYETLISTTKEAVNLWLKSIDSPYRYGQTEAVGDAETGNHAGTEPKLLNQFDNDFKFSGLLNMPRGKDDWFEVIDAMTKDYYLQLNNSMPTEAQAWVRLCENPPTGYGITANKDNLSITMIGIVKPFNKRSFDRRWAKYTAKSSQI